MEVETGITKEQLKVPQVLLLKEPEEVKIHKISFTPYTKKRYNAPSIQSVMWFVDGNLVTKEEANKAILEDLKALNELEIKKNF